MSLCALIGNALKHKPFDTYSSGLRLGVPSTGDAFYVDLCIFDKKPDPDSRDPYGLTYLGPMLLAEIVSPRTNVLDRVWKFDAFRSLDTVREFLFVFENRPEVHTFSKIDDRTWLFRTFTGLEAEVPLQSVGITLAAVGSVRPRELRRPDGRCGPRGEAGVNGPSDRRDLLQRVSSKVA